MFCFRECITNSDCKNGETCDRLTNTCRKPCEEKKDCNGTKLTCDTSTGFCVDGEIYFKYNMVQGFYVLFSRMLYKY